MVPEDKINEFLKRLQEAAGSNIEAVILYGSTVSGDFLAEYSNINLFCVLRDSSFRALRGPGTGREMVGTPEATVSTLYDPRGA